MSLLLGPVLGFHGLENNIWKIGVLTVTNDSLPPKVQFQVSGGKVQDAGNPVSLINNRDRYACRQDINIALTGSEQTVWYWLVDAPEKKWSFITPAQDASPRMTFSSCNGFSNPRDKKKVADHNVMWRRLSDMHGKTGFHLMIMGGDQVYADTLWENVTTIKSWCELPEDQRLSRKFTAQMSTQVDSFYFNLYLENWGEKDRAKAMSSIPSIMMWDDHDIFDGWGSYPDKQQNCDVYKGIYAIAKKYFVAFQLRSDGVNFDGAFLRSCENGGGLPSYCSLHRIGNLGLLVLDLRSERTGACVMSRETWDSVFHAIDAQAKQASKCDHLMAVTSIPVVHPDFGLIEDALNFVPGQQELEDDLRDHWHSRPHKDERRRFIHRLLNYSAENSIRVTLLSGDVHVGAMGVIESTRNSNVPTNSAVVNQLTASAIVHPAPPAIMGFALEQLGKTVEDVERGITTYMLPLPGLKKRFIGARNWLSLEPDTDGNRRYWANWQVEGEELPFTKAIHPCA